MQVPSTMHTDMSKRNPTEAGEYTWDPLPAPIPLVVVKTYNGVDQILSNPQTFVPRSDSDRLGALTDVVADRSPVRIFFLLSSEREKPDHLSGKPGAARAGA
jgi:hypothetical protein